MDHYSGDSGFQLIIDNRKIIIAGAFLILVCGAFFVIGFMEGKRQGLRSGESAGIAGEPVKQSQDSSDNIAAPQKKEEKTVRDQLNWYSDVNKPGDAAVQGLADSKEKETASADVSRATVKTEKARPEKVTYSVQIGAFKQRKEAEVKAAALKAKNYNSVIEPPSGPDQLFLLKVGRFESRADAVAMQNRLKKDGFNTFIKTNK